MKLHTCEEAAELLRVSYVTVWRQIQNGKLGAHYIGRRIFISDKQIEAYLNLVRKNPTRRAARKDDGEFMDNFYFAAVKAA